MNLQNRPPIFVPHEYWTEIEKLSKSELMDMAWDYAKQMTPEDDDGGEASDNEVMGTFRAHAKIILTHRKTGP